MNTKNLVILTRTPLHVGAGSSVGAVDQPVQRERHTGFPIIPGSSIKGVMRAHFSMNGTDNETIEKLFGPAKLHGDEAKQGHLSFGEAKLLLFPVRSAKGSFAFVTSSLAVRRFLRDSDSKEELGENVEDGTCLSGDTVKDGNSVVLEEYRFEAKGSFHKVWQIAYPPYWMTLFSVQQKDDWSCSQTETFPTSPEMLAK